MRIGLGKDRPVLRVFEPVATVNDQYMIVDCGIEHTDGSLDVVAVGLAAASAKRWLNNANPENQKKEATAENKVVSTGGPAPVAAVNDQPPGSVSDWDGNDLDIEGL